MYRASGSGYEANTNGWGKIGFISIGSSKGVPTSGSGDPTGANYIYAESSKTTDTELLSGRGGISVYIKKGNGDWRKSIGSDGTSTINEIVESSSWARPSTNPVEINIGSSGEFYIETLTSFFTFSDSTYSSTTMAAYVLPYNVADRAYFT